MAIKKNIKKILIIKLRGIGDIVLSTIVLDNLKASFPEAKIDYLVDASGKYGLEGISSINSVYIFPKKFYQRIKFFYKIFLNKYDLVLDFFSNPSTALLTFISRAEYRVGFPYRGRKYAYNIFGPKERDKYHSATLHLKTLELLGINIISHNLHFFISEDDQNFADKFFLSSNLNDDFVFGISPTGGWQSKKCDPEKFAEFSLALLKNFKCRILVLWGPSDYNDAIMIRNLVPDVLLAPPSNIRQMGALIKRCDLLIANDSGPMHIATAVGTPVLSLHGPTNPLHQGPFGEKHDYILLEELECIKCNLLLCPHNHECFKNITIELFLNKINNLIKKNRLEDKLEVY